MILTETPRRKLVTKLVTWGHWFALANIIIAILIASIYVYSSPMPGTVLGTLYLFTNWLSHVGFLTFIGFVIFILPLCYLLPNAKLVKAIGSGVGALGLALLAFDALLYNRYGLHLSLGSAELIRSEAQTVMAEFGWQQWGFLLLLFVVWLSFQIILSNALWQRLERVGKYKLALPISSFFVLCFVTSHAVHVWADANLYQPIVQQDDMFPLSYPATAKTLMSKYGLLDIANYQQRKALQFESHIEQVNYPASPVYCGINYDKPLALLVQTDQQELPADSLTNLNAYSNHYDLSSDAQSAILSTLFGMPELYLPALTRQIPLLIDLPSKLGLNVIFYSDTVLLHEMVAKYTNDYATFKEQIISDTPKLAIGFVNQKQMQELLNENFIENNNVLITVLAQERDKQKTAPLYTNIKLNAELSSHEDIAATALSLIGCNAPVESYTTGQNLVDPKRNWLVTTQGSKVIVLHNGQRIEVLSNGNFKIYDRETGNESVSQLNTGLLSQAIKHLSRFNR